MGTGLSRRPGSLRVIVVNKDRVQSPLEIETPF